MIFLNMLCQVTKGVLRVDWVSLGVLIGYEGKTVVPLSMFTPKFTKTNTNIGSSQAAVSDDSLYDLALLILVGYRVHHATNQAYIERLQTALKSQLITPDFADGVEVAVTNFAQLYVDPEFVKRVCGIDMFFSVFPHHPRAKLWNFDNVSQRLYWTLSNNIRLRVDAPHNEDVFQMINDTSPSCRHESDDSSRTGDLYPILL